MKKNVSKKPVAKSPKTLKTRVEALEKEAKLLRSCLNDQVKINESMMGLITGKYDVMEFTVISKKLS